MTDNTVCFDVGDDGVRSPILLGLIHWKLVIHCFVDGFSRFVLGIRIHNNNRARTVLDLFLHCVAQHGTPSRVRGDHGTENLGVAQWMEERRGVARGSYIWGRYAVHLHFTDQADPIR